MGEVNDVAAKRAEKAAKAEAQEPEHVLPDGIACEAGLTPDGQGVVWVNVLKAPEREGDPPTVTHRIGMYADLAYKAGQLIRTSAATVEVQADTFRRQHARRLANEQKQARTPSGLILPPGVSGSDNEPVA